MTSYVGKRVAQGVVTFLLVSIAVFILSRLSGDPLNLLLPTNATEARRAALRSELGLDQSWPLQYLHYMHQLVQGHLGDSLRFSRPVLELVPDAFLRSLSIGAAAMGVAIVVGVPCGVLAASRPDGVLDRALRWFSYIGMSAPQFAVALLLIFFLAVTFPLFPATYDGSVYSGVLPCIALSLLPFAGIFRLTQSSMLEALADDSVTFARAQGVGARSLYLKHALRNASPAVMSLGGLLFVQTITGVVVVETVFAWPGIGNLAIGAVRNRDYPVVQAIVLLIAILFIVTNLIMDLLQSVVDPRVRLD